jgi:hypothetical protein
LSVAQLAPPFERALFCRLSSQADFFEWLATAPSLIIPLDKEPSGIFPFKGARLNELLGGHNPVHRTERSA